MRLSVCLLVCIGLLALPMAGLSRAQRVSNADMDGSGEVDLSDFLLFAKAFGSGQSDCDFDGDGTVGFSDFVIFAGFFGQKIPAQDAARFVSVALGVAGGITEDNLTSYLLAPAGTTDFVALDAGTLLSGIRKAYDMGSFGDLRAPPDADLTPEGWILQNRVRAYLITHAHLDHVAGLVIGSTDDTGKSALGLAPTIDNIRDHLFNWQIWPNFGDEGEGGIWIRPGNIVKR